MKEKTVEMKRRNEHGNCALFPYVINYLLLRIFYVSVFIHFSDSPFRDLFVSFGIVLRFYWNLYKEAP